jgi:membrane-associated protease RseP (regulator of RpoE activity)
MAQESRAGSSWASHVPPETLITEIPIAQPEPRPSYGLALGLFIATLCTTLLAGAAMDSGDPFFPFRHPSEIYRGIPFSFSLMAILLTHEMGHYLTSRYYGVKASLPYFIPAPPVILNPIGTFGAFISMRSPILKRQALLEIGAMGPIAGFVVAFVAVWVGLENSTVAQTPAESQVWLGSPLLFSGLAAWLVGLPGEGFYLALHPVAVAGWFGLFVTALNLLPIGQLDGGHITYALFGRKHRIISIMAVLALAILGVVGWPGWFVWGILGAIIGLRHPPVVDQDLPLGRRQRLIAWASLVIFVLTFTPVPFSV